MFGPVAMDCVSRLMSVLGHVVAVGMKKLTFPNGTPQEGTGGKHFVGSCWVGFAVAILPIQIVRSGVVSA